MYRLSYDELTIPGGDLSGASQPHKHLQFIPVEQGGPPVEKLAKACHVDVLGADQTSNY